MFKSVALTLLVLLSSTSNLVAAPKSELWERWTIHNAESSQGVDHRPWAELLRQYLYEADDQVHRFAYSKVTSTDRGKLNHYIDQLSQTRISDYNRNVQRAYWINLYNALTIQEVLHFFPIDSIRDISSGIFSSGPWKKKLLMVQGEKLSLNDIEHRILRPIWQDPRIHYAVNCASIGCPNLRFRVFTANTTEAMLDRAAREFINHPRCAAVVGGKLQVSSIFDWFMADFGGDDAGVIAHLKRYAMPNLLRALENISEIDSDNYDWRINSVIKVENIRRVRGKHGS